MIAPEQLCLNNWVNAKFQTDDFNFQVKSIKNEFIGMSEDISYHANTLYPIPITPDILLKAGFNKNNFNQYSIDVYKNQWGYKRLFFSGSYLYLEESVSEGQYGSTDLITIWNKDFKKEFYLHELQNLFLLLSGKNLNIEL